MEFPREITEHYDGHGLAESIKVVADEVDPNAGGASHSYVATINGRQVADIQFQHGPRNVEGSTPGVLDSVLIAIVADRLKSFQAGNFPSRENAIIITKLEEVLMWMRQRADARAKRGVLGKNIK